MWMQKTVPRGRSWPAGMPEMKDPQLCLVLIVEDDMAIQEMLRDTLQLQGFRTAAAQTGAAALEVIQQTKPDLILLDLTLPDMNGYELIKLLQNSPTRDIPIVVVTARAMNASTQGMIKMESNVKGFFSKPLRPYALALHLHELLHTTPPHSPISS